MLVWVVDSGRFPQGGCPSGVGDQVALAEAEGIKEEMPG